jgi:hypothetical protein
MTRILLLCILLPASAFGQIEGNPANWCREGFFTRDSTEFKIATVRGGRSTRAYFYGDDRKDCPSGVNCRRKAFLVGGDHVLTNRSAGGFRCAWFTSPKGVATVGWIKNADLTSNGFFLDRIGVQGWLGEWVYGDNSIEFTENKLPGYLNVTGNATWVGANPGNVHVGEIDGRYEPKNGVINYSDGDDEYDCKMTMRLLGTYLIVADNLKCGGVNVTFSGVYKRKRK